MTAIKKPISTRERAFASAGAFAFVAALILVRQINPAGANFFPQCPLHALTGLNCPGCGATRGMHALLNGDVLTALHFNVLLVIYVPLMIFGFCALLSLAVLGRGLKVPQFAPGLTWGLAVVIIAFGVLRNLPFYPFTILAP